MKRNLGIVFLCLAVLTVVTPCAFAEDSSAYDQLQNMQNTGVTFDGSDGQRSGMDVDLQTTEVPLPEPTPEEVQ